MNIYDLAIKSALILMAAWAAALMMRRASSATRHLVWALAVCATLTIPLLSPLLPQWRILPSWIGQGAASSDLAANTTVKSAPSVDAAIPDKTLSQSTIVTNNSISDQGSSAPAVSPASLHPPLVTDAKAPASQGVRWQMWIAIAWACGSVLFLLRILVSLIGLWRMGRTLPRIEDHSWTRLSRSLAKELRLHRPILLLRGLPKAMPMTWGFLRPKLLLPPEAETWCPQRRRIVLLHEMAHIRRADFLVQSIVHLARAIYWFNPLMWLASKQIALESEGACDDLVLAGQTKASDYAEHLLAIAAGLKEGFLLNSAAVAMARSSRLEARLLDILDGRRNRTTLTMMRTAILALLMTAIILPVAALRGADAPQPQNGPTVPAAANTNPAVPPANVAFEKAARDARAALIEIERFARLPADQQTSGFPHFYRDIAHGSVSPMAVMLLSSYPENIFKEGKYNSPGGDYESRWVKQLQEAATTLTPEQVAEKLPFIMVRVAAHVRTLDLLRKHSQELTRLLNEDLDSKQLPNVNRACAVIGTLALSGFTDKLLPLLFSDTPLSKPAESALIWVKDPALVKQLLEQIEKNPKNLIRCAGLFQGPLAGQLAEPALLKLMEAADPEIRIAAAYALYECVDARLAGPIAAMANDADPRLNNSALNLAMKLPADAFKSVRDDLAPLLSSKDPTVARSALTCFARRKDLLAGPIILAKLKLEKTDDKAGYDVGVMQALSALADSTFGYDPHNWGAAHNQKSIARFEKWLKDQAALPPRATGDAGKPDLTLVAAKVENAPVRITGVVRDPDGNPVAGATVAPADGTGNSLTGDTAYSVLTANDGTFIMTLPASGDAKYNLEAHDGQYGQWRKWANGVLAPIQTKPGDELKNVIIKLTRPATVSGHIKDETGNPLTGREVRASAADKRENRYYDPTTKTDKNGDFELRFIRPGEQFIQAAPFFWANVPEGGMTLKLKPGETNSQPVTLKAGEIKTGIELTAPKSMAFPTREEQLRRALERMERH